MKTVKRNNNVLWLLLIPLLIPICISGTRHWRNNKVNTYDAGGFKDIPTGERASIKKLVAVVRNRNELGKIRVGWSVTLLSPKTKQRTSLYSLEFDYDNKRMIKFSSLSNNTNPLKVLFTQYENVTIESIEQISTENGLIADLTRHGAVLRKHGIIELDLTGKPIT